MKFGAQRSEPVKTCLKIFGREGPDWFLSKKNIQTKFNLLNIMKFSIENRIEVICKRKNSIFRWHLSIKKLSNRLSNENTLSIFVILSISSKLLFKIGKFFRLQCIISQFKLIKWVQALFFFVRILTKRSEYTECYSLHECWRKKKNLQIENSVVDRWI